MNKFLPPNIKLELLVVSFLYFIPALSPQLFGWLIGLMAIPCFYLFMARGIKAGSVMLGIALIFAGIGSFSVHGTELFLLSLTLLPMGYSLFKSSIARDPVAISAGKGLLALGLAWLFFWGGYGVIEGVNPYKYFLTSLDQGIQQSLALYTSKEAGLPPDIVYNLTQATAMVRERLPDLFPALLASLLIITVWVNVTMCNMLMLRFLNQDLSWGKYATWRLPDHLIWFPISALTIVLLNKQSFQQIGILLLVSSILLYFFQGLAITIALLDRWRIPSYLRSLFYIFLIIQSYSILLLALLGISDTWIDFRQKVALKE